MALAQWPNTGYLKFFDTDERIRLGSYTPNVNEQFKRNANDELGGIYVYPLIKMTLAGTEKIKCHIYGDSSYSSAIYSSSWSVLSTNISNITSSWHGWVLCEFASGNLNKNITYYIGCEISGYTRVSYTSYIGLKYDYPNPVIPNSSTDFTTYPVAFKVFSYKARA